MTPSREGFTRWLDNSVTEWVMRAMIAAADANKAAWIDASWEGGACSKEMLAELRTRADAYRALPDTDYDGFCDMLGEQPNED